MGGPNRGGRPPEKRRVAKPGEQVKLPKVNWKKGPAGNADLHSWPRSKENPNQTVLDTARGRMIGALNAANSGRVIVGGKTVVQDTGGTFYRFEVVAGGLGTAAGTQKESHIICTGIGRYAQ